MEEDIKKTAKENFHNYNKRIPSYLNIMKRNGFTLINREYDKTNNNQNHCIYTWGKNNIRHRSIFKTGGDFYGYSIEKTKKDIKILIM